MLIKGHLVDFKRQPVFLHNQHVLPRESNSNRYGIFRTERCMYDGEELGVALHFPRIFRPEPRQSIRAKVVEFQFEILIHDTVLTFSVSTVCLSAP